MNKVYILSLNYNQSSMTLDFISSMMDSDYDNFIIMIADNGSNKSELEILKKGLQQYPKVLFEEIENNIGYVGGMNFLLKMAKPLNPDYYLVINNDTKIDKNAIKELVLSSIKHDNNCLLTGKVYEYDKPDIIQTLGSICINKDILRFKNIGYKEKDLGQYEHECERDMIDDIFWLLPSKVFNKVGYYNPIFFFNGESADYALRVKKLGFKLIFCPKAKLWHKGSLSVGGRINNPYLSYWQTRSTLTFRYLHLKKSFFLKFYIRKLILILYAFIKNVIRLLFLKKPNFNLSIAAIKGMIDFNRYVFMNKR